MASPSNVHGLPGRRTDAGTAMLSEPVHVVLAEDNPFLREGQFLFCRRVTR